MSNIAYIVMVLAATGIATASAEAQPVAPLPSQTSQPAVAPLPPLPFLPPLPTLPLLDTGQLRLKLERAERELERAHLALGSLPSLDAEMAVASALADLQRGASGVERSAGQAREREAQLREREADLYEGGYTALSEGRFEQALDRFTRVIELKGERADRALYWKAYAQHKLGQSPEALASLAELVRTYPKSRYLSDAKALEAEIRERAGQPPRPESQENEELKLLALRALQNTDPAQAIPMLETFLKSNQSPRLKERTLFVLAQSESQRARQVVISVAKGEYNPDLQLKAVQYLGYNKSAENRAVLADIYRSSTDLDVKRRILRAFMTMGDSEKLVEAARTEALAELRAEAARQLGNLKALAPLWELYQKETNVEVRVQILRGLTNAGDYAHLSEIARTEQNLELRRTAVRNLGIQPIDRTGATITAIYEGDVDVETRKAAIEALFIQRNDVALVALARKEKDLDLKKSIVQRLSTMKSKVALDYLMEILSK